MLHVRGFLGKKSPFLKFSRIFFKKNKEFSIDSRRSPYWIRRFCSLYPTDLLWSSALVFHIFHRIRSIFQRLSIQPAKIDVSFCFVRIKFHFNVFILRFRKIPKRKRLIHPQRCGKQILI